MQSPRKIRLLALVLCLSCLGRASDIVRAQGRLDMRWAQSGSRGIARIAYSRDGGIIAVVGDGVGNIVKLIRASDGSLLRTIQVPWTVNDLAFSPDGVTLGVASGDKVIRFYRIADGKLTPPGFNDPDGDVRTLAFSPNSQYLVTGTNSGAVRLWSIADGSVLKEFLGHSSRVSSVAFSPDSTLIASGGLDNLIKIWSVATRTFLRNCNGHTSEVKSVAFKDSTRLVSGSADNTAKIWNVGDGTIVKTLTGHQDSVNSVAYSPDRSIIASSSGSQFNNSVNEIKLWNASDGSLRKTIAAHSAGIYSIAFSPDGRLLASVSADSFAKTWKVADGTSVNTFLGYKYTTEALAFKDANVFASVGGGSVSVWNTAKGELLYTNVANSQYGAKCVAFSPNGSLLAVGTGSGNVNSINEIKLWNAGDGSFRKTLPSHTTGTYGVAFSPDNLTLASANTDGSVRLWKVNQNTNATVLTGHTGDVNCVAYAPNGSILASGDSSGKIIRWNAATGALLDSPMSGHTGSISSIAFSPDSSLIVSGSDDQTIKIWNAGTGAIVRTLTGHASRISAIALSTDGLTLFSSSSDATIKIWRISDGVLLRTFRDDRIGAVYSLALSQNGKTLGIGGWDGDAGGFTALANVGSFSTQTMLLQSPSNGAVYYWRHYNRTVGANGYLWRGGDSNWKVVGTPDLNGDGVPDVLLQYGTTGQPYAWILNADQTAIVSSGNLTASGAALGSLPNWNVVATPDLNHDGKSDVVLQNSATGAVYYWLMNGNAVIGQGSLWNGGDNKFRLFAMPDLNGDGVADALFQYSTTGNISSWTLNAEGTGIASTSTVWSAGLPNWNAIAAKEMDGDGSVKVVFQNAVSKSIFEWSLIGGAIDSTGTPYASALPGWSIQGTADVTNDGKSDLILQNDSNGSVYFWSLDGFSLIDSGYLFSGRLTGWKVVSAK